MFSWDDSPDVRIFAVPKDIEKAATSNGACKISESVRFVIRYEFICKKSTSYRNEIQDISKCLCSRCIVVPFEL